MEHVLARLLAADKNRVDETLAEIAEIVPTGCNDNRASIKNFLAPVSQRSATEMTSLQIQVVRTLSKLIKSVKNGDSSGAISRFLEFGLNLVGQTNHPDVRSAVYKLFASISTVLKKDMSPSLQKVVSYLWESLRSPERVTIGCEDEGGSVYVPVSDVSNGNEKGMENSEHSNNDDVTGRRLQSPYLEEKKEAILTLSEIAQSTGEAFLPYVEKSFEETFKLTSHAQVDLKEAAMDGILQFCLSLSKINSAESREKLSKALSVFVPKLSDLVRMDSDETIAMNGMWIYVTMLKEIKGELLLRESHREAIVRCVTEIMMEKTKCQAVGDGSKNEVEEDVTLFEYASEVFSSLGKVIPPEEFATYFMAVLPILSERCKSRESEAQRSMAIGMIAKCISGLKDTSGTFVEQLLPLFYDRFSDECRCVRHNAFWALGELILYSKEAMYHHYSSVLSLTEVALAQETEAGPRDNMIGVIAKMIIANYSLLDINRLFPSFVKQLPLQQDFVEYQAVFDALAILYRTQLHIVKPHLQHLLIIAHNVLQNEDEVPNDGESDTSFLRDLLSVKAVANFHDFFYCQ